MKNLLPRLILLAVVLSFIAVAYLGYLAFYPFKGLVIENNPVPVLNSSIEPGDVLSYKIAYCRYTDTPSHFTRTLRGPVLITLTDSSGSSPKGCRTAIVKNTVIPSYAQAGTYYLETDVCLQLTALQNKCISFRTQDFQVK